MIDIAERLINLALYLAATPGTVTAEAIRRNVSGYPEDQDEAAFKRMLERDKDFLRSAGFAITCDDEGNYRLDRDSTYAARVELKPAETAALRAAGTAMIADASFPFPDALRLALSKLSAQVDRVEVAATSALADEDAERQGEMVAVLSEAARTRKRVSMSYTNSLNECGNRDAEPYGLFLHAGRWYLVARDSKHDAVRTFSVTRISAVSVNSVKPRQPDFERPADFAVERFIRLPFQYGDETGEVLAEILIDPRHAARVERIAARSGAIEIESDGSATWRVPARSLEGIARFVIEHGPGLELVGPEEAVRVLREGAARAEAAHG